MCEEAFEKRGLRARDGSWRGPSEPYSPGKRELAPREMNGPCLISNGDDPLAQLLAPTSGTDSSHCRGGPGAGCRPQVPLAKHPWPLLGATRSEAEGLRGGIRGG